MGKVCQRCGFRNDKGYLKRKELYEELPPETKVGDIENPKEEGYYL